MNLMRIQTKVDSQGRITIPKRVRDALGLQPGNKLKFERKTEDEIVFLRCVPGHGNGPDRFESFQATDELKALLRGGD
jgi:AbrB family looped-hinge helix DNA binding protein